MIRPTDPVVRDPGDGDPREPASRADAGHSPGERSGRSSGNSRDVSYAAFVREHTPALLRTAYVLTGNALAAEELVQDTMVRLLPKWSKVEAAEIPLAYVRRTLANQYVNQRRRASRREFAYADVPEQLDDHDPVGQLADRDQIWAGLGLLPERQRAALVLRYYEDLDDAAIADTLNARVGTVRSLISRGLATLRTEMTP